MAVSLYMDQHVPKAITTALRLRGVDVLTAYEDGTDQLDDERVLQRAHELKRALFTQDDDLLGRSRNLSPRGQAVFWGHLCSPVASYYWRLRSGFGNHRQKRR